MKKIINLAILLLLIGLVSAHEGPGKPHGMTSFDWILGIVILILILVILIFLYRKKARLTKSSRNRINNKHEKNN